MSRSAARRGGEQVIECRVDSKNPLASSNGRSFQVRVAAWKDASGEAHPDPIVLKRTTLLPARASVWAARMPAQSLCRVLIGPIEKRPYFYPTAPLLGLVGDGEDLEFAKASEPLVTPQEFVDAQLGVFRSRLEFPRTFEGSIDWHGKQLPVSIERGNDFGEETLLRQATQLRDMRSDAANVMARALLKVEEELYHVWVENGWHGDDPVVDAEEWKSRLILDSINVDPDGSFELVFEDGGLFAGHAIIANANETGSFDDAMLFG